MTEHKAASVVLGSGGGVLPARANVPDKAARAAAAAQIDNPNNQAFGLFDEFDVDWAADISDTTHSELLSLVDTLVAQSRQRATGLKHTLHQRLVTVRSTLDSKKQQITNRMSTAPFMRLRDKIAFVLGLWSVGAVCYWLGAWPHHFYQLYTAIVPITVLIRLFRYHLKKWHYYLFDFCYYVNFVVLLYLYVWPTNAALFKALFMFSMGPLCWSVPLFRNSLVLHSLDKLTSVFIHLFPSLLMWAIRWYPATGGSGRQFAICDDYPHCTSSLYDAVYMPALGWLCWGVAYYLKVFVLSARKVEERGYDTLFKYLTEDHASRIYSFCHMLGTRWAHPLYMVLHMTLFVLTGALALVWWNYFILHSLFLLAMVTWSAWNGSCFYMDYFAKRYELSLQRLEKTSKHVDSAVDAAATSGTTPSSAALSVDTERSSGSGGSSTAMSLHSAPAVISPPAAALSPPPTAS